MHLDGARLWEAVSAGAGSLMEYCACFDSVSLCFSKGLGAPIGSMIVGSQAFIGRARHIRKGLGGGMRQAGVVSSPARVAVEETFLGGKLEGARERAREIARRWEERGGRLKHPVETNMVWLDLEAAGVDVGMFVERGVEKGVKVIGGRLVVHYREYLLSTSSNMNFQNPPFHLIITQPPPYPPPPLPPSSPHPTTPTNPPFPSRNLLRSHRPPHRPLRHHPSSLRTKQTASEAPARTRLRC